MEGSQYEPYRVTVEFGPGGDIVAAECTCPYDWGGDCKHIIATLLCLVHRSQEEEIVDAGKAGEYDVAIRWLRRRRDILLAAGRKAQWDAYLQSLLEKRQRKYKLVPMLKTLGQ